MKINLCRILKGHEGEIFYSPLYGLLKLRSIKSGGTYPLYLCSEDNKFACTFTEDGKPNTVATECLLFPFKDQRDWNKWDKENNKRTPKTWSELIKDSEVLLMSRATSNLMYEETECDTPIEKSALALLKIHKLIEADYGGNVTNAEWRTDDWKYKFAYFVDTDEFIITNIVHTKSLIAFHTKEQAEEFLSYPENVQLLKDYFMI